MESLFGAHFQRDNVERLVQGPSMCLTLRWVNTAISFCATRHGGGTRVHESPAIEPFMSGSISSGSEDQALQPLKDALGTNDVELSSDESQYVTLCG